MVLANYLRSKSENVLLETLRRQKAKFIKQGFTVTRVLCDGESAVSAFAPRLEADVIEVDQAGPETHISAVEVQAQHVKKVCRSVIASLPYTLAKLFIVWLVYFSVSRIAMLLTSVNGDAITPREFCTGKQVNALTDLALSFGERVEVHQKTTNTMTSRTRPGIALVSTGNAFGTWKVYMMDTGKVATMDRWTAMPMDQATIGHMNSLAASDTNPIREDLEFRIGRTGRAVNASTDDPDDLSEEFASHGRRERVIEEREGAGDYDPTTVQSLPPDQATELDDGLATSRSAAAVLPSTASGVVAEADLVPAESESAQGAVEPAASTLPAALLEGQDEVSLFREGDVGDVLPIVSAGLDETGPPAELEGLDWVEPPPTFAVAADDLDQGDDDDDTTVFSGADTVGEDDDERVEEVEESSPPQLGFGRYNLRSVRHYGHKHGSWRERQFESGLHISVKKAVEKFGSVAEDSMVRELTTIHNKGVMEAVRPSSLNRKQRRAVIRSSMFLKEKFLPSGEFEKLKSRFVAGGNMQDRSVYSEGETSSPTITMPSAYMIASIAAMESRHVFTMDVGGAYLNADMEREVLLRVEPKLAKLLIDIDSSYSEGLDHDGSIIVRLKKALYGCVESSKLWFENLSRKLLSLGFKVNGKDSCVFNLMTSTGAQLTVGVYVDDLLCTCADEGALEWLALKLTEEYKELAVHRGKLHSYLGHTLDFTVSGRVRVTMEGYIADVLKQFNVSGFAVTPATADLFSVDESSTPLDAAELESFHSQVAKLLYLAKRVRPDLLTAVAFLTTRVQCATVQDSEKLRRVLKYLNATPELGVVLEGDKGLQLLAYVDSSFAVHPSMKSHTGGVISLGRGPVWAKSAKQKLNTKSSTEAELVGVSDALSQVIWTRDFLLEQGYDMGPARVFQDNLSTIALAERGNSNAERTRHIAIRFFFVKDRIEAGEVAMEHLSTTMMVADLLTKPLQGEQFRRLRKFLLNWEY
jgi:hypothetical protein